MKLSRLKYVACLLLIFIALLWYRNTIPFLVSPANSSSNNNGIELRGVWLTNVASGVLFVPGTINRSLKMLSQLNFNTVYPVVWNRGTTLYPSEVARQVTGTGEQPLLKFMQGGTDVLHKIVKLGHGKDLQVVPWFEYGLMAPANSSLAKSHQEWLTQSRDNDYSIEEEGKQKYHVWLNPLNPEVQQFLQDLVVEVVRNYDVDGIQFDDHFGLFSKITQSAKAVKPDITISLATNPYQFAYTEYLQDWLTWVEEGLVDELILQVYRDDIGSFSTELSTDTIKKVRGKIPISIAIFTGNPQHPVSMEQIEEQVKTVRDRRFDGLSFFYWESLWSYLTPDSPRKRRQTFQTLFSQPALVPEFSRFQ
ncbi:MAG: family 10 glycosylhydrolase [Prochloron sp. SP5CPC1]|nr:family 10 glycosylhydrolase [Candidatus Paraprochloron terpiosi SP5CPC1]